MARIQHGRINRPRTANTNKQHQLRKLKRNLLRFFLFFLLVWTSITFLRSDFFHLDTIAVSGNSRTTDTEIITALAVKEGQNIWQLSMAQLEKRVLTIPHVAEVKIKRDLPRTLRVVILEKKVLALVPYQEYFFEMSMNGQLLALTQEVQDYDLPLLTGMEPLGGTVGDFLLTGEALTNLQAVSKALAEKGIALSEINLQQAENVVIVTMDGLVVWLGRDNYVEKAGILEQIADKLAGRQNEGYLDLRAASAPAFHLTKAKQ